ncbi:hypothetical protein [Nostoc sp.]|uniref:hypothetical protein n=1 Tax=Nostoc sp. TaxID=1180 RepID=UPI002FF4FED9
MLTVSESDLSEYYAPIARAIALAIFISQQQEFPSILTNHSIAIKLFSCDRKQDS